MKATTLTKEDGTPVCERCLLATSPLARMKGLLGRSSLGPGEGMLFRPGGSIHTFFMRFRLDVIFCDRELSVIEVARDVGPWRIARSKGTRVVVEMAAGAANEVAAGDRLVLGPTGG
jgi:uncharacterized membrane protein (UPF0127 family)